MPDFWQSIKNLFTKAEQSSPTQPLIHKLIERTEAELADYDRWKKSLSCRRLLDWIRQQHVEYLINPDHIDETIDFMTTPSSKGFVIHFKEMNYPQREIVNLFDYLKERVLAANYRSYVSELRTYNRPNWVETKQRHYLKPPIKFIQNEGGQLFRQRYGNISIELLQRNEEAFNLKLSATAYNDRLYESADNFQDLMQHLVA
ncbi:MAG: hypothetical protein AAGG75_23925 [Bacteroidota bacterium]